ncbi:hypothetical protein STENM327S_01222 [Streptomyces tendae]
MGTESVASVHIHGPSAPFLPEAYASLCAQELPDGWEWRWVIQEDGRTRTSGRTCPTTRGSCSGRAAPAGRAGPGWRAR